MLDSEYFFYYSLWSYVVDKCGNERKKLPLYEIWRRRIQSQGVLGEYTNTVWRWWYGSYDKCAPGNVEIATLHKPALSHRWGYKPYYHRKISDHTQKETFSGKAILNRSIRPL